MDTLDLRVLRQAYKWFQEGLPVVLYTVVETWVGAQRPVGSLLALCGTGQIAGSVSGGCVEDDLLARLPLDDSDGCELITYSVTEEEAARFGLSHRGTLRLVREPLLDSKWIEELVLHYKNHEQVIRRFDLKTGQVVRISMLPNRLPPLDQQRLRG